MSRVVVSGSIAYDTIMNFHDQFAKYIMPERIHQLSVNFNINEMVRYPWGTAHNIAYAMKQCGHTGVMVSSVGTDFTTPSQCGWLDYTYVAKSTDLMTAAATIITDDTNNQITAFYPWASSESAEVSITEVANVSWGIVSPNNPMTMLRHVKDLAWLGIPFFFDPGQPLSAFSKEQLHEIMALAPYLTVNEYEKDLFCKIAEISFDDLLMSFEKVIVTLGKEGVELWEGPDLQKYEANVVDTVVDPTGAGDALRWGMLAWLMDGKSWGDAIQQGQGLAAICIQSKGTLEWSV